MDRMYLRRRGHGLHRLVVTLCLFHSCIACNSNDASVFDNDADSDRCGDVDQRGDDRACTARVVTVR
jgi:hypothetical protein